MIEFGVNLNNREPLIAPDYDLQMLLDLSERVEECGFESVWVGDSLFSKPRYEPISLLSAISQRTSRVRLGTACMVSSTRNPLYLALEWATLDVISGGRTIFGTGMGNPEEGVRREFEQLGLDYVRGTLKDNDEPLPRIPPLRFRGGLRYQRNAFQAGGDVSIVATQDRVFSTETPTDGYQLGRLYASYSFGQRAVAHTFTARLENVTNELYRNHLSLIKDLVPEMGRNFRLLYNVKF